MNETKEPSQLFKQFPRTMLLTASPPGDWGVGSQYLHELLRTVDLSQFACFGLVNHPSAKLDDSLAEMRTVLVPTELQHWSQSTNRFWRVARSHSIFRWKRRFEWQQVVKAAVDFAKKQNAEQVWGILESPELFHIASRVSDRLGCPLVTTVWDPPEGICTTLNMDRLSRKLASRDFHAAIQRSTRCAVISDRMKDEYLGISDACRFTVMRNAPPAPAGDASFALEEKGDEEVRIVFTGSLYATAEFAALVRALDTSRWSISGRPVRLQLLGRKFRIESSANANIQFLGWRPPAEVNQIIQKATFSYVPYWFDSAYAKSVELCFPTKLVTALCMDCPVFFHGPADSSPGDFLRHFPAGVTCSSLDTTQILHSLHELVSTPRSQLIRAARMGRWAELNSETFHQRFRWLLTGSIDVRSPQNPQSHEVS